MKGYSLPVGLRKAAWVALYAAAAAGIEALKKHLSADQALMQLWWVPALLGMLTLAGNALRYYRKSEPPPAEPN